MPKDPPLFAHHDLEAIDEEDEEETRTFTRRPGHGGGGSGEDAERHLLVGIEGSMLGQVIRLGSGELGIGRHPTSGLRLGDSGVSRTHARILSAGAVYLLKDLKSSNGTFVKGQQVYERVLEDGDLVEFGPVAVFRYSVTDANQERMLRQLYQASVTDRLTGVGNRAFFDTQLAAEASFARRHNATMALLILDIDHFKAVNDSYGHQAGDAVLASVAGVLRAAMRTEDVLARYGGEEFAVVLRGCDLREAGEAAERLRVAVEGAAVRVGGASVAVTMSIGCASLQECGVDEIVALADRRLYAAKRGGRNRVVAKG